MICTESKRRLGVRQGDHIYYFADCNKIFKNIVGENKADLRLYNYQNKGEI